MENFKDLEDRIIYNMCQAIDALQPFNTTINKDNDITNLNIGYLKGLAACIEMIHEPKKEVKE